MSLRVDFVYDQIGSPRWSSEIDAAQIAWCPARFVVGAKFRETPMTSTIISLLEKAGYDIRITVCTEYLGVKICGDVHALRVTPEYVDAFIVVDDSSALLEYMEYSSVINWILSKQYKAPISMKVLLSVGNAFLVMGNPPSIPTALSKLGAVFPVPMNVPVADDFAIEQFMKYYTAVRKMDLLPVRPGNYCKSCPIKNVCIEKLQIPSIATRPESAIMVQQQYVTVNPNDQASIAQLISMAEKYGEVKVKVEGNSIDAILQLHSQLRQRGLSIIYEPSSGNITIKRTPRKK